MLGANLLRKLSEIYTFYDITLKGTLEWVIKNQFVLNKIFAFVYRSISSEAI